MTMTMTTSIGYNALHKFIDTILWYVDERPNVNLFVGSKVHHKRAINIWSPRLGPHRDNCQDGRGVVHQGD